MKVFTLFIVMINMASASEHIGKTYRETECFSHLEGRACSILSRLWNKKVVIEEIDHHVRVSRGVFYRFGIEAHPNLGMLGIDLEMFKNSISALLRKQVTIGAYYILRF